MSEDEAKVAAAAEISATAVEWVTRFDGQSPPAGEAPEFERWLAGDPSHASAYEDALRTWRDLAAMGRREEYQKLLGEQTFRERMVSALSIPRMGLSVTALAAVIAIAWLVVTRDALFFSVSTEVATQLAEVREVSLPDGSLVTVGARSKFDYEFTSDARHATIADGDAFFSVTKDPARPFYVSIGEVQVKVVGTQFEVRRRAEGVSVAVVEGIVEVSRPNVSTDQVVSLKRGEAVVAERAEQPSVHAISTEDVGAWRSGRLVYDNVQLRDVVADANRYLATRILIEDPQLGTERITTSFRTSQVEGMLETLQGALPLRAEKQANGDILLRARR